MKDLTNKMYNGIKAIKLSHRDKSHRAYWIFKCHCSKHFVAQGYKVTSGHTRSCGCMFSINWNKYHEKIRNKILENIIKTPSGCWEWQLSLRSTGYAQIVAFGKAQGGHRVSYRVFKGDFDEKLLICHTCDNRKCVNPDHLFCGTHKDNNFDMHVKNRQNYLVHENANRAKLTKEKVLEARRIYATGDHGCSFLAKKYKVTSRTIWCAIKGITWKNLEEVENENN